MLDDIIELIKKGVERVAFDAVIDSDKHSYILCYDVDGEAGQINFSSRVGLDLYLDELIRVDLLTHQKLTESRQDAKC